MLSEYVDVIVVRANRHDTAAELAAVSSCSVINGLTDLAHPCQAMADLFTLRELVGRLDGHTLAWIGDGNNVARSLAIGCGKAGHADGHGDAAGLPLRRAVHGAAPPRVPRART